VLDRSGRSSDERLREAVDEVNDEVKVLVGGGSGGADGRGAESSIGLRTKPKWKPPVAATGGAPDTAAGAATEDMIDGDRGSGIDEDGASCSDVIVVVKAGAVGTRCEIGGGGAADEVRP
jgi:hypothetical protein